MATGIPQTKWNGRAPVQTNHRATALALNYEGKTPATEILSTAPAVVHRVFSNTFAESEIRRLYFGDNLHVLAALLQDSKVRGNVSLIYIDPPYATNSVFQSRSQEDAYSDLLRGSEYAEFVRKRLILLRELLSERGSIYVHLDANMIFAVKLIMDEVFGERNFRSFITRKKCNPKNYTKKVYGNTSDYILFYTKTDDYVWHRPLLPWDEERIKKEYNYIDAKSGRRYKKVPLHAPGVRNGETGKPWRGKLPPPGKHWQYPPSVLDEMEQRGEIYWSPTQNPRRKVFFELSRGIPVQDIWLEYKDAHNQNIHITGYPTEKNLELLKLIVQASSNEGDLVLDCFAGSGTTLVAADGLQRNWIGIDNSFAAVKTMLKRFRSGSAPMGDYVSKSVIPEIQSQTELSLFSSPSANGNNFHMSAKKALIENYSLFVAEEHLEQVTDLLTRNTTHA